MAKHDHTIKRGLCNLVEGFGARCWEAPEHISVCCLHTFEAFANDTGPIRRSKHVANLPGDSLAVPSARYWLMGETLGCLAAVSRRDDIPVLSHHGFANVLLHAICEMN